MKSSRAIFLVVIVASTLGAAVAEQTPVAPKNPGKGPVVPPLTPRFLQIRDHIDALFHYRNEPPPPPDPRSNPFRAAGSTLPVIGENGAPVPESVISDLTLLQQAVAPLKVSGTVEKDNQLQLVINARPYKKNDVVQSQVQGQTVYLRVRELTHHTVTLALNETELTLKF
jgi:hypothetical protein